MEDTGSSGRDWTKPYRLAAGVYAMRGLQHKPASVFHQPVSCPPPLGLWCGVHTINVYPL